MVRLLPDVIRGPCGDGNCARGHRGIMSHHISKQVVRQEPDRTTWEGGKVREVRLR